MTKAEEFRRLAQECEQVAERVSFSETNRQYRRLAESYRRMADEVERLEAHGFHVRDEIR